MAIELARRCPDLVSGILLAEGNLLPGGGKASRHISSVSVEEFAASTLLLMMQYMRDRAPAGDAMGGFIADAWAQADPNALHANAAGLVNMPGDLQEVFLSLNMPVFLSMAQTTFPKQRNS